MSFLEYSQKVIPSGLRKVLYLNWALVLLLIAVSCIGFVMLYSVAGGSLSRWAEPQMTRFALGFMVMLVVAFIPIWFWRNVSLLAYIFGILLLLWVMAFGVTVNGSQRWIDLGFMRLQPSELNKITVVMLLAAYYERLDPRKISQPLYVLIPIGLMIVPMGLTFIQPDVGTAALIGLAGIAVMFCAGVHWIYFAGVGVMGGGIVASVFLTRDTAWQLLSEYHYRRIDIFLNPGSDPLGFGYQITQSQIALGSGGWTGRGFLQGTQSQLNFLPENETDFIFTSLAEEFGFVGSVSLLLLYLLILVFCFVTAMQTKDRFASLVSLGVAANFFLYFAINMAMVMGLVPVVGVPLPLVSYGGSVMLVLLAAFGLVQSAHIHRPR